MSDSENPKPNNMLIDSTIEFRMNSTAWKISEAFDAARIEARDEALWLSALCRRLLNDSNRLRIENEKLKSEIESLRR